MAMVPGPDNNEIEFDENVNADHDFVQNIGN